RQLERSCHPVLPDWGSALKLENRATLRDLPNIHFEIRSVARPRGSLPVCSMSPEIDSWSRMPRVPQPDLPRGLSTNCYDRSFVPRFSCIICCLAGSEFLSTISSFFKRVHEPPHYAQQA